MKTETRVMDVTSTLQGEKVQMGLDPNAVAHIMSVLTDLYSDQEQAVIREYSTNAFDAHVEAGQTRPIEVTTPSPLSPFFTVQDFGVGLSADDIRDIYSQYGASTKRNSNEVVGMLGLGCKSALTYTDQFTLTSVKDGVCTQVSISRDEDGGGSMTIVAQYETDESNGTKVTIPVKGGHDFESKARNFFRFWTPGTVLVNGAAPKRIDGIWLTDNIVMTAELDSSYVVMGNVAYPFDSGEWRRDRYTATFVAIGDVNFTPSRESLQMTPKTKATLDNVKRTIKVEMQAAFKRQVDAAPNAIEALKTYYTVQALGYEEKAPVWNGTPLPTEFRSADPKTPYNFITASGHTGRGYNSKGRRESVLYTKGVVQEGMQWFINFTSSEISPYKRGKLDKWLMDNNKTTPRTWILMDTIPSEILTWIDPAIIHNWQDVEAVKLPAPGKAPRQDGRPTGSYEAVVNGLPVSALLAEDIDTSKPVYWVTKQEYYTPTLSMVQKVKSEFTLVKLGLNRIKKFERDFPNAIRLSKAVDGIVAEWEASLTDEDKMYLRVVNSSNLDALKKLDEAVIDDPELVKAIKVAKTKRDGLHAAYKEFQSHSSFDPSAWVDPSAKYVLLDSIGYYGYNTSKAMNHVTLYLNAAFAAGQEA